MIESTSTFLGSLLNFDFTSMMGLLLYWLPLSICVFGYTLRTAKEYMKDKDARDGNDPGSSYYTPQLTVGSIVGRGLASSVPVANLWAALFDVSPKLFVRFFDFMGKFLNAPLVPDNAAAKQKRADQKNAIRAHEEALRAAR